MVQATIDNAEVQVQLAAGESVTVPTGESWKVQIYEVSDGGNLYPNGTNAITTAKFTAGTIGDSTLLTEGDQVIADGGTNSNREVYLIGWKV